MGLPVRAAFLLMFAISSWGCQTTHRAPPVLPGALAPFFGTCAADEGAATLQLFEDGALIGSAEVEWTSNSRDHWNLEVLTAAGSTLASAARHGFFLETTGPISKRLPPLSISMEDKLLINGNFSGLKAHELLCLLGGRLPYDWLSGLTAVDRQKHRTYLFFSDDDRQIMTEVESLPETSPRICSTLKWNRYWFFSQSIKWCLSDKNQRSSTLEGWKGYSLKWVRFE